MMVRPLTALEQQLAVFVDGLDPLQDEEEVLSHRAALVHHGL